MAELAKGVVAAGHPTTAQAGAGVLREGGNAVDAAVPAMLTSVAVEPLLTGLGAGGYMLVAGGGRDATLLDFFVEAPTDPRSTDPEDSSAAELVAITVSFGDAAQVFHVGPSSCGVYGTPAGICEAIRRWGTLPLESLAEPAARSAGDGVQLNAGQAYVAEILSDLLRSTPECAALWAPGGRILREGETLRNPELGESLRRLGRDGAEPFYRGDVASAVCRWLHAHGGACSVTCTNGEGSGVVVPGTGIHINNVMGEEDLNPLGFHRHPPGRRMPSMMAPSVVMRDGEVELVLGSAGSNRIRSALLQTIVGVVDHGLSARQAVDAPRAHLEHDFLYVEPGIDAGALEDKELSIVRFGGLNLFFGGVQAVLRREGALEGAGDPRRGGVAVSV